MPVASTRRKSIGYLFLILFLGALIGSALGEVIGLILPPGVVREFFLRSAVGGIAPATLNASLFTITLGFSFKLNVIGIIGVAIAAYIVRWY
ncbi:MAG: DUF4321 domain-containing protein [Calditrichaeota bacterium]|nr:DUF4321 domain-containing protein [Calditrichota bacterium]